MSSTAPTPESHTLTEDDRSLLHRVAQTPLRDLIRGRVSGSLDWRHVIDSAELPGELKAIIRRVVKRWGLTRGERADVARELVAHFGDGIDAGATAEALASSFGDVDTAGKLIARSKRRGRSHLHKLFVGSAKAFGVCVLLYVAAIGYYATGEPNVAVDYMAKMNEPALAVPAAERAWPVYREALRAWPAHMASIEADASGEWFAGLDAKPGDEDWPAAVKLLESSGETLALTRRAAAMKGFGFVHGASVSEADRAVFEQMGEADAMPMADGDAPPMLVAVLLPYLSPMRNLARLVAIDAYVAAQEGDGERFVADVEALLGMSRGVRETGILINDLMGLAIHRLALDATEHAVREHPETLTDAHLQRLAHRLSTDEPMRFRLDGERMMFADIMQRVYTDDGTGDGHLTSLGLTLMRYVDAIGEGDHDGRAMMTVFLPALNAVIASRAEMTRAYDRAMDRTASLMDRPLWESIDDDHEFHRMLAEEHGSHARWRYAFVTLLLPALDALNLTAEDAIGRRDGVLVGLALEMHRRRAGAWPGNLAELSPTLLPRVPRDRFTGAALRYTLVDDRPVVYSVGADRDDDGGRMAAKNAAGPREMGGGDVPDGDWVVWGAVPDGED